MKKIFVLLKDAGTDFLHTPPSSPIPSFEQSQPPSPVGLTTPAQPLSPFSQKMLTNVRLNPEPKTFYDHFTSFHENFVVHDAISDLFNPLKTIMKTNLGSETLDTGGSSYPVSDTQQFLETLRQQEAQYSVDSGKIDMFIKKSEVTLQIDSCSSQDQAKKCLEGKYESFMRELDTKDKQPVPSNLPFGNIPEEEKKQVSARVNALLRNILFLQNQSSSTDSERRTKVLEELNSLLSKIGNKKTDVPNRTETCVDKTQVSLEKPPKVSVTPEPPVPTLLPPPIPPPLFLSSNFISPPSGNIEEDDLDIDNLFKAAYSDLSLSSAMPSDKEPPSSKESDDQNENITEETIVKGEPCRADEIKQPETVDVTNRPNSETKGEENMDIGTPEEDQDVSSDELGQVQTDNIVSEKDTELPDDKKEITKEDKSDSVMSEGAVDTGTPVVVASEPEPEPSVESILLNAEKLVTEEMAIEVKETEAKMFREVEESEETPDKVPDNLQPDKVADNSASGKKAQENTSNAVQGLLTLLKLLQNEAIQKVVKNVLPTESKTVLPLSKIEQKQREREDLKKREREKRKKREMEEYKRKKAAREKERIEKEKLDRKRHQEESIVKFLSDKKMPPPPPDEQSYASDDDRENSPIQASPASLPKSPQSLKAIRPPFKEISVGEADSTQSEVPSQDVLLSSEEQSSALTDKPTQNKTGDQPQPYTYLPQQSVPKVESSTQARPMKTQSEFRTYGEWKKWKEQQLLNEALGFDINNPEDNTCDTTENNPNPSQPDNTSATGYPPTQNPRHSNIANPPPNFNTPNNSNAPQQANERVRKESRFTDRYPADEKIEDRRTQPDNTRFSRHDEQQKNDYRDRYGQQDDRYARNKDEKDSKLDRDERGKDRDSRYIREDGNSRDRFNREEKDGNSRDRFNRDDKDGNSRDRFNRENKEGNSRDRFNREDKDRIGRDRFNRDEKEGTSRDRFNRDDKDRHNQDRYEQDKRRENQGDPQRGEREKKIKMKFNAKSYSTEQDVLIKKILSNDIEDILAKEKLKKLEKKKDKSMRWKEYKKERLDKKMILDKVEEKLNKMKSGKKEAPGGKQSTEKDIIETIKTEPTIKITPDRKTSILKSFSDAYESELLPVVQVMQLSEDAVVNWKDLYKPPLPLEIKESKFNKTVEDAEQKDFVDSGKVTETNPDEKKCAVIESKDISATEEQVSDIKDAELKEGTSNSEPTVNESSAKIEQVPESANEPVDISIEHISTDNERPSESSSGNEPEEKGSNKNVFEVSKDVSGNEPKEEGTDEKVPKDFDGDEPKEGGSEEKAPEVSKDVCGDENKESACEHTVGAEASVDNECKESDKEVPVCPKDGENEKKELEENIENKETESDGLVIDKAADDVENKKSDSVIPNDADDDWSVDNSDNKEVEPKGEVNNPDVETSSIDIETADKTKLGNKSKQESVKTKKSKRDKKKVKLAEYREEDENDSDTEKEKSKEETKNQSKSEKNSKKTKNEEKLKTTKQAKRVESDDSEGEKEIVTAKGQSKVDKPTKTAHKRNEGEIAIRSSLMSKPDLVQRDISKYFTTSDPKLLGGAQVLLIRCNSPGSEIAPKVKIGDFKLERMKQTKRNTKEEKLAPKSKKEKSKAFVDSSTEGDSEPSKESKLKEEIRSGPKSKKELSLKPKFKVKKDTTPEPTISKSAGSSSDSESEPNASRKLESKSKKIKPGPRSKAQKPSESSSDSEAEPNPPKKGKTKSEKSKPGPKSQKPSESSSDSQEERCPPKKETKIKMRKPGPKSKLQKTRGLYGNPLQNGGKNKYHKHHYPDRPC
uniref:Uncharacterized protein n=1 Tax=Cacopsylla melanoneura TaxID=428564 RepID=A0A8D8W6A1_9HEMI